MALGEADDGWHVIAFFFFFFFFLWAGPGTDSRPSGIGARLPPARRPLRLLPAGVLHNLDYQRSGPGGRRPTRCAGRSGPGSCSTTSRPTPSVFPGDEQLVKAREGRDADYWSMVRAAVLEPIGVPRLPISRSIESDGALGVPIMGRRLSGRRRHGQGGAAPAGRRGPRRAPAPQPDEDREAMRRAGQAAYPTSNANERYLHSVWTVRTDTAAA